MKEIYFTRHAIEQMQDRGAVKSEVVDVIREGEFVPSKHGRWAYRKNFPFIHSDINDYTFSPPWMGGDEGEGENCS